MKFRTPAKSNVTHHAPGTKLLRAALLMGAMLVAAAAAAEGGGTPIADQGVPRAESQQSTTTQRYYRDPSRHIGNPSSTY